jgi:hypothetical protein
VAPAALMLRLAKRECARDRRRLTTALAMVGTVLSASVWIVDATSARRPSWADPEALQRKIGLVQSRCDARLASALWRCAVLV